jgi:hypothetical protein
MYIHVLTCVTYIHIHTHTRTHERMRVHTPLTFTQERDAHKDDWRNLFPRPGIVYSAAKADPDLRNAILSKLMAGDFPGMQREGLEEKPQQQHQQQQQQQQQHQHHRPAQHASPSSLHKKKPRLSRQNPSDSNTMQSLEPPSVPTPPPPPLPSDAPALTVDEDPPPHPPPSVDAAKLNPPLPPAPAAAQATAPPPDQPPKKKPAAASSSASASLPNPRKPQPSRRPLNRSLHPPPPLPSARPPPPPPDSARALRESAYFSTIPGENLVVPRAPASSGPANFPNSSFGKGGAAVGGRGTVRVVGKNGAIGNVPQQMMA